MQPGDILFTVPESDDPFYVKLPRATILFAASLKAAFLPENTIEIPIVHAAIAVSETEVIESVKGGLEKNDLTLDTRSAIIFSPYEPWLASSSVFVAERFYKDFKDKKITADYSVWKAFMSTFKFGAYDQKLEARIDASIDVGIATFCSEFVANAFEVGKLYSSANLDALPPPVFPRKSAGIQPFEMATYCATKGNNFFLSGLRSIDGEVSFS
ncbi:hypothetical protein HZF02_00905 [Pseudomonas yamanorum]|nr:hypothetical protein HZF02_00905 [Pseudomonas yamanorum]